MAERKTLSIPPETYTFSFLIHSGFGHEQNRNDRDRYVRINFENLRPGSEGSYRKIPHSTWDSLGTRYELRSVMHYGSWQGQFSNSV